MKNLSIKIISPCEEVIWGLRAYLGEIQIGTFSEKIYVPVEFWSLDDYMKPWQEGLKRIESENKSCLVVTIQGTHDRPSLLNWWLLYKKEGQIIVENSLYAGSDIEKLLKGNPFTPETCYQCISRMSRDKRVSKWIIDTSINQSESS
jgi:hypothetical protein